MPPGLEVYEYDGVGYRPLVSSQDWMVARLNYEPIMSLENAREIERHVHTDEVFILLTGRAALYITEDGQPLQVVNMKPFLIYNITAATWHNLLATLDARFVIVEKRDTDIFDTEIRPLTASERQQMMEQLPAWVEKRGAA